jgi:hypothetical protein
MITKLPVNIEGNLSSVNDSTNSEYVNDEKNDKKTKIAPKIRKNSRMDRYIPFGM